MFICHTHGWRHAQNPCSICHPEHKAANAVPDLSAEDIVKPLDPFSDMTTEEQLFWATPHYDELQEKKRLHQEALNNGVDNG